MNTVTTIQLPPPAADAPMVARMISKGVEEKDKSLIWVISRPHPLTPDVKIIRMFFDQSGVEIYSTTADGKAGMRDFIPMSRVILIGEAMTIDVFVEELVAAESDEDDDEEEPEVPETPDLSTTNGQAATS